MGVPFWDILLRTKEGPIIEEKQFDLSIFRKTQELQKKYDITYDPEKPLDVTGDLADRVYRAGVEFFLDMGTYCTTTRRVIKVTEQELEAEMAACPRELELGQGADRVKMVHRDVEGDQEPIVCAGIQTTPFSDENFAVAVFLNSQNQCFCQGDRKSDRRRGGVDQIWFDQNLFLLLQNVKRPGIGQGGVNRLFR